MADPQFIHHGRPRTEGMKSAAGLRLLWPLILFCLFVPAIFASPAAAEKFRVPLHKLAPAKNVTLKCTSAEYSLKIPIPDRWQVSEAVLAFSYINSVGLLADRSRMTVKVNGYPITQIPLNPLAPEGFIKLSLPALLLEPGYNDLSFNVSQHYTNKCESPCADDLWTVLNLDQAYLEIEYQLREVPLKLSSIASFLFDPRISPEGRVHIVMPDAGLEAISLASIAASGTARRFDYRNVVFSVSNDIVPGLDNILVGNKEFVRKLLLGKGIALGEIKSPILKIMHLPLPATDEDGAVPGKDPRHALLVITGENNEHVRLAAETFAIMSTTFPDTTEMSPLAMTMPDIPMYGGRLVILQDKKYPFKTLNFPTQTFKGLNPTPAEIVFRLPADFLIKPNLYADISLHFAYGAAIRADSALNVSLNGKLVRAIQLNDVKGALIEGYKMNIPTHMFKPGTNFLRFEPVLTPLEGKDCEFFQTDNLFLTILDNSTLYFPPMPHLTEMPRVELFMLNGFPFTRWPDAHDSMVYLSSRDANTISAALNLIGVITQKNGYPLLGLKYTFTPPVRYNGELMIIGDVNTLPESLKKIGPMKLTKRTTVPYPVVRSWGDEASLAFSDQISGLSPGRGVVMEFQSPDMEGRTVLMFTAVSSKDLLDMTHALMEPAVQAKCEGNLVLVELTPPDYKIVSMSLGEKYFAGKSGKISKLDMYLYRYPWLYYVALAVVVLVLSGAIFFFLLRYRKRRIRGE